MARRVSCRWIACVLVLAFAGWHGAIAGSCFGAEGPAAFDEGEENVPDMNYVKFQAEAGRATSQTQLADFFLASSDFTNAVIWYRKAADQGHVPAQLSLAGCLMSGRGVAKDASGAARLLRQAADLIEFRGVTRKGAVVSLPPSPTTARTVTKMAGRSIVISKEALPAPTNAPAALSAQTNPTRVSRVDTLAATDAVLQEVRLLGGAPSDFR
jgi:hypothetical protein